MSLFKSPGARAGVGRCAVVVANQSRVRGGRAAARVLLALTALILPPFLAPRAMAAIDVESVDDSILDAHALLFASSAPYGRAINGVSYQTEALMTYDGYQFAVWYHRGSDEDIYLARRSLGASTWEFMDSGANMTRTTSDAHNVISMGISGDGVIHLSFDHHGHTLRYLQSSPGAATGAAWNAGLFAAERASLNAGGSSVTVVTYPRFISDPATGDLYFVYRTGSSGNGDAMMAHYDMSTGLWSSIHEFIDGRDGDVYSDPTGSSSTRNAYLNGLHVDGTGRLHTTWTWRESAGGTNHDIAYAYSDNGGTSWRNSDGINLGSLIKLTSLNIDIDDGNSGNGVLGTIDRRNTVMNQQTQTVDLDGRVHAIMWHADDAHANSVFNFDTTVSDYYHYHRDPVSGNWTRRSLPTEREVGSRPDMAFDADGNLFAVYVSPGPGDLGGYYTNGDLIIAAATKVENYANWEIVYTDDAHDFAGEPRIDQERLLADHTLSIFVQENSQAVTSLTGTPLHVFDFSVGTILTWVGDDLDAWTNGSGTDWDSNGDDVGDSLFSAGDTVRFDDGAASFNVDVTAPVAPAATSFENTVHPVAMTGSPIGGTGALSVRGGGLVTLDGASHTYTGDTVIEAGTLALTGGAEISASPSITVAAGASFDVAAPGQGITLTDQTLTIDGSLTGDVLASSGASISASESSTVNGDLTMQANAVLQCSGQITGNLDAQGGTVRVGDQALSFSTADLMIDDLESYAVGNVRDNASPPWVAHANTADADVESYGGSKVLTFGNGGYMGVSRQLPDDAVISNAETATFFFRFNSKTDDPDNSFGLADTVDTGGATFANFETQVRVVDDGGASGTFLLDARNGAGFTAPLATGLATNTWYNVWMVINQTTDKYDVYLNTGTADADAGDKLNGSPLSFRNGTAAPLSFILGLGGPAPINDAVRYDDMVHFNGVNLANPLGGADAEPIGDSVTLTVDSDCALSPAAALEMEIVNDAILDRLIVAGTFQAGGTLQLAIVADAPTPQVGDTFDIMDAGSFGGGFSTIVADALSAGSVWDLRNLLTSGVVRVIDADDPLDGFTVCMTGPDGGILPGCALHDRDNDGDVDVQDYASLQDCVSQAPGVLFGGC